MEIIRTIGKYTLIHRADGKIVIASDTVYDHIGTHGKPGKGSVFSGYISSDIINKFLISAEIPQNGGGIKADFGKTSGYLLVAPFEVAMQFDNVTTHPGTKEDFDPEQGKMVPVPIIEVHTSQPIDDFGVDEISVLVFPYDTSQSAQDQNDFINNDEELTEALTDKKLYALATAFPGGFSLSEVGGIEFPEQQVPKATAWGGIDNPTWAVIIPGKQSDDNPLLER